ncbi:MAG: NTP transferase domain-containing protein [Erysipelotrichaceae bacterium]|nr:NTP transferase domain-containing protein [Erysipelotrichaceae bacterium]
MISAIVMAAGKGTRMHSDLAKTMHKVLGKPMVDHIYETLKKLDVDNIVYVVGYGADTIKQHMGDKVTFALQQPQLGSGHAVMQADVLKGYKGKNLIINGDCPLITTDTYSKMLKQAEEYPLVLLTVKLDDPAHYGRIVRDEEGNVLRIREFKDCTPEEAKINEINAGIYCVDNELLWQYLPEIKNDNAQKEYYVTDLVGLFNAHGHKVTAVVSDDPSEMSGINNRRELVAATAWLRDKVNNYWLDQGVEIVDTNSVYISTDAKIGKDTVIYPNVRIEGNTVIGESNTITEGTYIENAVIGNGNTIISSRIVNCEIGDDVTIGPWVDLTDGH